jgi:hypothetical protein
MHSKDRDLNFSNHPLLAENIVVSPFNLFSLSDEKKTKCFYYYVVGTNWNQVLSEISQPSY